MFMRPAMVHTPSAYRMCLLALVLCVLCTLGYVSASTGKTYKPKDKVPVYVNGVGPFHNPAETYEFYSLPYCAPKKAARKDDSLGEVIAGDRLRESLYDIRFGVDVQWQSLCASKLNQDAIKSFREAVLDNYMFEMFADDLPLRGFVGEIDESQEEFSDHVHAEQHLYLFTHLAFDISFNGPHVIAVNLTTDPAARVGLAFGKDLQVEFSYSVHWHPTTVPFVDRMSLHSSAALSNQSAEIHWLSIINSFVLVVLLTAMMTVILLRVLRKDIAQYMEEEDTEAGAAEDGAGSDESGWKLVHGDVFRTPPYPMLLSAVVGTGTQLLVLTLGVLLLAVMGMFYPGNRGALYSSAMLLYCLTAGIAGFVSTNLYLQFGGDKWATNAVLAACLFAVPVFVMFTVNNAIAAAWGSTSAMPFSTIMLVLILWAVVTFPLTILGSTRARKQNPKFEAPCKTNQVAREIPEVAWYRSSSLQVLLAGFLPFSAIYIELHYVFNSVWGHGVYTLFGILLLAFILLLIVTAFITVALTYFQLAAEDYRWWWRAVMAGGSTGLFVYAYAMFFYSARSNMSGVLQGFFFFGYMLMISYAFILMLGSVGFWVALKFVRYIYGSIKVD